MSLKVTKLIMRQNRRTERLKEELMDALDGSPGPKELQQLKEKVIAHDPVLWEDFQWFSAQKKGHGIFGELEAMRREKQDKEAIRRFYKLREAESEAGADLEMLVWSWFRRYVLTAGIVLTILFAGIRSSEMGVSEVNGREQVEHFLGWHQEELPGTNHWLYADF